MSNLTNRGIKGEREMRKKCVDEKREEENEWI